MALQDTLNLRRLLTPTNLRQLAAPILIIMILSMMVLPLPVFLLDVFFTFNIAISVMVMLVAMYSNRPLDFSVFPTVLLALPDADLADAAAESSRTREELALYERPDGDASGEEEE